MKAKATTTILTILFGLALGASLRAANIVVQLGQNIQPAVASAQVGDVVIMRGGSYPEQTISGSKAIRLVREKNTSVTIGGSLSFSDVNASMVLRDLEIDVNGNGQLSLSNCAQFGLEDLTKLPQGITVAGSTVVIRDCVFTGNLTISGSSTVQMINSSCVNLSVNNSTFDSLDSTFAAVTVDNNSTVKLVNSNYTTGSFTDGSAFLRNCTASGNVTFTQCDWQDHGSTYNGTLTSNQSHTKLFRSTVKKAFTHGHAAHGGVNLDCVIFQSTIGRQSGDPLLSKATRTWVTYSTIHHAYQEGGTEAHFIGNDIYVNVAKGNNGIVFDTNGSELTVGNNHFYSGNTANHVLVLASSNGQVNTIHNTDSDNWVAKKTINFPYPRYVSEVRNEIKNQSTNSNYRTYCKIKYFYLDGSTADSGQQDRYQNSWSAKTYPNPSSSKSVTKIEVWLKASAPYDETRAYEQNTAVRGSGGGVLILNAKKALVYNNLFRDWDSYGNGIIFVNAPSEAGEVRGNAFWRSSGSWEKHAVNGPSGVTCTDNYFHSSSHGATGTLANFDNFSGSDPKFVNNANDWSLQGDSPLKDKGPNEAQFRDHDGSRNDAGLHGGHAYDPTGKTSDKPVVLSADQSVFRIITGDTNPLLIKARAAVATP